MANLLSGWSSAIAVLLTAATPSSTGIATTISVVLLLATTAIPAGGTAGRIARTGCHYGRTGKRARHDMRVIFDHRDRLSYQLLNIPEKFPFFFVTERQGDTIGAGSTCPAYTMNISLRNIG